MYNSVYRNTELYVLVLSLICTWRKIQSNIRNLKFDPYEDSLNIAFKKASKCHVSTFKLLLMHDFDVQLPSLLAHFPYSSRNPASEPHQTEFPYAVPIIWDISGCSNELLSAKAHRCITTLVTWAGRVILLNHTITQSIAWGRGCEHNTCLDRQKYSMSSQ